MSTRSGEGQIDTDEHPRADTSLETADEVAMAKAGLKLTGIDVIELNEAFAAQVLAVMKEWGFGRRRDVCLLVGQGGAVNKAEE